MAKLILNSGLLPRDGWEYGLSEVFRALTAVVRCATKDMAIASNPQPSLIPISK